MAWTWVWGSGAEMQHVNECEEDLTYGSSSAAISSTKAKTGTYSYAYSGNMRPRGKTFPSTSRTRSSVFINHNGLIGAGGATRWAIIQYVKSSVDILVAWNSSTATLDIVVGGSVVDSINVASAGFSTTNTWHHVGVTCKADASTGFVSVYLDGVQILTYSGNTGTGITACYFGGRTSSSGSVWAASAYFDDFMLWSGDGSDADEPVPSYRLLWSSVSGAGTLNAWTVTGAATAYECLDDGVPNDNTDYIVAASSGLKSYLATTDITVPAGYEVSAVYAASWTQKTDAGTDSRVKLGSRLSSTDSTNTSLAPTTTYGPVMERHATNPSGAAWSESDVNNAELMIESAGTF